MSLLIILFITILSISFLCSILESILLSINMPYINLIADKNKKDGKLLKKIKNDIDKSISSILIINTLSNTLGATMIGMQASLIFGGANSVFIVSVVFTFCVLFFSEIIPKTIGAIYYKPLAVIASRIINVFIFISYPLIIVSSIITSKINKNKASAIIGSKEELLHNVLIGEKHGIISDKQSDIIENTLASTKSKLHDILTPRSVVYAISIDSKIKEILENEQIFRFSRVPIYEKSIDHIIGVMLSKNLFKLALEDKNILNKTLKEISKNKSSTQDDIISKINNMNENIPIMKALNLFVTSKEHMLVVVDKYGQTEGIVTLEDCLEQLLGVEIVDESDEIEDMQELASSKMKEQRKTNQDKTIL